MESKASSDESSVPSLDSSHSSERYNPHTGDIGTTETVRNRIFENGSEVGDFVYVAGEIVTVNPGVGRNSRHGLSEEVSVEQRAFPETFGAFPILLGGGHTPIEFEESLLGNKVGDTGQTEFKMQEPGEPFETVSLTEVDTVMDEPIAARLEDHGITSAWDILMTATADLADYPDVDTDTIQIGKQEAMNQLYSRHLLSWEIVDAYRWRAQGHDGLH